MKTLFMKWPCMNKKKECIALNGKVMKFRMRFYQLASLAVCLTKFHIMSRFAG